MWLRIGSEKTAESLVEGETGKASRFVPDLPLLEELPTDMCAQMGVWPWEVI